MVAKAGYGYDPAGHLTSQTATGLAGPASSTYTYDQAGRLATWDNGTTVTAYGYDGNGNLTTDGTKTLTYDPRDELTGDGAGTYSYTARGTPSSEPGPAGALTVSFDAYGDQAAAGTGTYTYDALGRLTTVTPAAGAARQLSYAGATGTIASDGATAYTWDPAGTSLFASGNPGGGSGSLVLANPHGDVTGQFSPAAATVTASQAYDPWGTVTATSGTLAGQLGYQSALTDTATGKDLMGARWYNPAAGSFTSADTIPQPPIPGPANANPYAYTADQPLDATDPSGHGGGLLDPAFDNPFTAASALVALGIALTPVVSKGAQDLLQYLGSTQDLALSYLNPVSTPAVPTVPAKAPPTALPNTQPVPVIKPVITTVPKTPAKAPAKPPTTVIPNDGPNTSITTHQPTGASPAARPPVQGPGSGVPTSHPVVEPGPSQAPRNPNQDLTSPDASQISIHQQIAALIAAGAGSTPAQPPTGNDGNCPPDPADLLNLTPDNSQDTTSGGQSFTPGTRILLPGGKTAPISSLRPGDKVTARDTSTGKDQTETVTAVEVHHDTDLYNLTVKDGSGTEVIHTTSNHLFYDPYLKQWRPASKLKKGEHLQTPDGTLAVADGGTTPKVHIGDMWDLTVPGNNDHDFYVVAQLTGGPTQRVVAEATPVLVHNVNAPCGPADGGMYGKLQPAGPGKQINHIPADWSTGDSITRYSGPAIRMDTADHTQLYTTGSSQEARAWRLWQQELISQGRIDEAMQMDINDIRARFGTKYDSAITQMINSLPSNAQYQALRTVPLTGDVLPGLSWSNADVSP